MGDHDGLTEQLRERLATSPFHGWAGMSVLDARPGEVEIALDAEPHHRNLQGLLHGGMIATLADTAAGIAVRTQARARSVARHRVARRAVPAAGRAGAHRGPWAGGADGAVARPRGRRGRRRRGAPARHGERDDRARRARTP